MREDYLMSTPNFESIYNSEPNFDIVNSKLTNNFDSFAEGLWDHMFAEYYNHAYTAVRHKDVSKFVDDNYYVRVFRTQLEDVASVINALEDADSANIASPEALKRIFIAPTAAEEAIIDDAMAAARNISSDPTSFGSKGEEDLAGFKTDLAKQTLISNVDVWDSYLQYDLTFKRKSVNILVYIFEIMKASLEIFEDMIVHKAEKIELHNKSIEIASSIIADVTPTEINDLSIRNAVSPYTGQATFQIPSKPDDFDVQLHNNKAGPFRDVIKAYRGVSQKRISQVTLEGTAANTGMTQQSDLLKAFVTFQGQLTKQVISKR